MICLATSSPPAVLNAMNARSRARPGLGRYQAGSSTASGSIFSMSMTCACSEASSGRCRSRDSPPPSTRTCAGIWRAASRLVGSVRISLTPPSRTDAARSASARITTATAPSRDSAAMATSALGRVSINTPTRSPCRTPTSIRPRTTLLMRRFTAS